ncbi:hypothetical protein OSB04_032044 [Centaurea solstitialis]|uniref:Uncharacterized protein n=1 Tax=Centaurea solstitialis TaxID=347529 RepID=A0AA38SNW3_9ASTR|nr:hypothetical protein OSB04_032044 [Centaurea solstitialis]
MTRRDSWEGIDLKRGTTLKVATCRALGCPHCQVKLCNLSRVWFRYFEGSTREIKWGSTKLEDKGFSYKHDTKSILDDCIKCAKGSGKI